MVKIKFRAWDFKTHRLVYDCHEEEKGLVKVVQDGVFTFNKETKMWDFRCDDYEIMQSTGHKDKNGREIFLGDILYYGNDNYKVIWEKFKFNLRGYYNGSQFIPECAFGEFKHEHAEVVGNKFINMEMFNELY